VLLFCFGYCITSPSTIFCFTWYLCTLFLNHFASLDSVKNRSTTMQSLFIKWFLLEGIMITCNRLGWDSLWLYGFIILSKMYCTLHIC
jgi:hypothetical protein